MVPNSGKTPSTRWKRTHFFLVSFLFLILGVALFLTVLPLATRMAAQHWLNKQVKGGARIGEVTINLFKGRLGIHTVVSGEAGKSRMALGNTDVQVLWRPLWDKRVIVDAFTLEDTDLDIRRDEKGVLTVGGMTFEPSPAAAAPATSTAKAKNPWQIGIGPVDLHDVWIRYSDPTVHTDLLIHDAHFSALRSWRPDDPTTFSLTLRLAGGDIRLRGEARPFAENPSTSAGLVVKRMPLEWLADLMAKQNVRGLGGAVSTDARLVAIYTTKANRMDARFDGAIGVDKLRGKTADADLQNISATWKGAVHASGAVSSPSLNVQGDIAVSDLRADLSTLSLTQSAMHWKGQAIIGPVPAESLSVDGAFSLSGLQARDRARNVDLAQIAALTLEPFHVKQAGGASQRTLNAGGTLALKGLFARVDDAGVSVTQDSLNWTGDVAMLSGDRSELAVQMTLGMQGLAADDMKKGPLARLASLDLDKIRLVMAGAGSSQTVTVNGGLMLSGAEATLTDLATNAKQGRIELARRDCRAHGERRPKSQRTATWAGKESRSATPTRSWNSGALTGAERSTRELVKRPR